MPWTHRATRNYRCFRCKQLIRKGTSLWFTGANQHGKYYRYHPLCKSLSGRKETTMTKTLRTFIKEITKGPKLPEEFTVGSVRAAQLYRMCVMMGLPVYKHIFNCKGCTSGRKVIYFHHKDRHKALRIVRELTKGRGNFFKQRASAILDHNEIVHPRGIRKILERPR